MLMTLLQMTHVIEQIKTVVERLTKSTDTSLWQFLQHLVLNNCVIESVVSLVFLFCVRACRGQSYFAIDLPSCDLKRRQDKLCYDTFPQ